MLEPPRHIEVLASLQHRVRDHSLDQKSIDPPRLILSHASWMQALRGQPAFLGGDETELRPSTAVISIGEFDEAVEEIEELAIVDETIESRAKFRRVAPIVAIEFAHEACIQPPWRREALFVTSRETRV